MISNNLLKKLLLNFPDIKINKNYQRVGDPI